MESIILASKSPRRKEILSLARIPFEVITQDSDESFDKALAASEIVRLISQKKLDAVRKSSGSDKLILSADTVVYHNGNILTKPKDEADAFRMLKALSGSIHEVYTGISMSKGEKEISDFCVTKVFMRDISDAEIKSYIKTGEPMDKAGAYGIQELGGVFVSKIDGDFFNVVGLPLCLVVSHLKNDFQINIL